MVCFLLIFSLVTTAATADLLRTEGISANPPPRNRKGKIDANTNITQYCANDFSPNEQAMWWLGNGDCSKAGHDMTYIDSAGFIREAKQGNVINQGCDSAICPNAVRKDCFRFPGTCQEDEWCMIAQQEVWYAAAGLNGKTTIFNFNFCRHFNFTSTESYRKFLLKNAALPSNFIGIPLNSQQVLEKLGPKSGKKGDLLAQSLWESAIERCGNTSGFSYGIMTTNEPNQPRVNLWHGTRGRCQKYRKEQESCIQKLQSISPYPRANNKDLIYNRPLLCGKGLICTGKDFLLPSTCVRQRPPDKCFLGPWWDSTVCPREVAKIVGGLNYATTIEAVKTLLLMYPDDMMVSNRCEWWNDKTAYGKSTLQSRKNWYNIVEALWPKHLNGEFSDPGLPAFEKFEDFFHIPNLSFEECQKQSKDPESRVSMALKNSLTLLARANHVWSLIHFFTFNLPRSMTSTQVQASRDLVVQLGNRFLCAMCRNYWFTEIMSTQGLAPQSNDPSAHATYWFNAHNAVNEHAASTLGNEPWIYGHGEAPFKQNPFFLSFQDAEKMWTYDPTPL